MYIIGGTKSKFLVDPTPISDGEMILNFDLDAGMFSQARRRDDNTPSDPVPSNLVNNSAFKLSKEHICVLWQEQILCKDGLIVESRETRVSILSAHKITWKHVQIQYPLPFYMGSSLVPVFLEETHGELSMEKILN
jgi:hypothetical protein